SDRLGTDESASHHAALRWPGAPARLLHGRRSRSRSSGSRIRRSDGADAGAGRAHRASRPERAPRARAHVAGRNPGTAGGGAARPGGDLAAALLSPPSFTHRAPRALPGAGGARPLGPQPRDPRPLELQQRPLVLLVLELLGLGERILLLGDVGPGL